MCSSDLIASLADLWPAFYLTPPGALVGAPGLLPQAAPPRAPSLPVLAPARAPGMPARVLSVAEIDEFWYLERSLVSKYLLFG